MVRGREEILRVRIIRGRNLATRDLRSSDPYVVLTLGKQKVKTKVIKKNLNPEWNEELTIFVYEPHSSLKLEVFDKDTFSHDDPMGEGEIDILPILNIGKANTGTMENGDIISIVKGDTKNYLVGESKIYFSNGKIVENMILRLKNVECGEVELSLEFNTKVKISK